MDSYRYGESFRTEFNHLKWDALRLGWNVSESCRKPFGMNEGFISFDPRAHECGDKKRLEAILKDELEILTTGPLYPGEDNEGFALRIRAIKIREAVLYCLMEMRDLYKQDQQA